MSDQLDRLKSRNRSIEADQVSTQSNRLRRGVAVRALVLLLVFVFGGGGGYMLGRHLMPVPAPTGEAQSPPDAMTLMKEVNPPDGYNIAAVFGDVGSRLVAAGAIDMIKFAGLYQQQNQPLTDDQKTILSNGTNADVVFTPANAYFLLNFFWALGLTNQNAILTEGPMMRGGKDKISGFASTGGWTLGVKKATELFSSTKIMSLTDAQQARLLEVASAVYRPCCNNPTQFPDCNHGMAMLGLLELMASQDASINQMFKAAKYVNAFWYPQQMLEVATAFKFAENKDFSQLDARTLVGYQYSSISGFQSVHQWLSQNGLLEQAPGGGGSCGVR